MSQYKTSLLKSQQIMKALDEALIRAKEVLSNEPPVENKATIRNDRRTEAFHEKHKSHN